MFFLAWVFCVLTQLIKVTRGYELVAQPHLIVVAFAVGLFMMPGAIFYGGTLFPYNGPFWSLPYELVVNALYAGTVKRFSSKALLLVCFLAWLGLAGTSLHFGQFNFGHQSSAFSLLLGVCRSLFGICLGLVLYRVRSRNNQSTKSVYAWLATLVPVVLLVVPEGLFYPGLLDIFAVTVAFPLAIYITSAGRSTGFGAQTLLFLGAASYPLYVIHSQLVGFWIPLAMMKLPAFGSFSHFAYYGLFIAGMVVVSALLERRVDEPIRKWLSKIFLPKPADQQLSAGRLSQSAGEAGTLAASTGELGRGAAPVREQR
jgi:peptidoglycan/LPS O-acetylase OafA/YrhL